MTDSRAVLAQIEQSFVSEDPALQEAVVESAMDHFIAAEKRFPGHLFCKDADTAYIVAFVVVILAGFEVDFNAVQFKSIDESLGGCTKCVCRFHTIRAQLRLKFLLSKGVPYGSMESTLDVPAKWQAANLLSRLETAMSSGMENDMLAEVATDIMAACMVHPRMLRLNTTLKNYFHGCFNFFNLVHDKLCKELRLYPGLIYLLFEGSPAERQWALDKLYSYHSKFSHNDLSPLVMEEFEIHIFQIQKPEYYNDERAVLFWANNVSLIKLSKADAIKDCIFNIQSSEAFKASMPFRILNLPNLFIQNIFSNPKDPLPILFRFFSALLTVFKGQTFDLIKPHNYRSFIDVCKKNTSFIELITKLPVEPPTSDIESDSSLNPSFVDLFDWIRDCSSILEEADNCQFIIGIFEFLSQHASNPNCGKFISIYIMGLFNGILKLKSSNFKDISNELTFKAQARSFLDKKSIMLFDNLVVPELTLSSIQLISSAISFDITALGFESESISRTEPTKLHFEWSTLWKLLSSKVPPLGRNNPDLIKQILGLFINNEYSINKIWDFDILYFKTKLQNTVIKNGLSTIKMSDANIVEMISCCNLHKKNVKDFMECLNLFFNRLTQHLPSESLVTLLKDKTVCQSIWLCIFSPQLTIYESTMGLLNESLDVDGRQEVLSVYFKMEGINQNWLLDCVTNSLSSVSDINLNFYSGVRRMVKIMMDLVEVLFDPVSGIFVQNQIDNKSMLRFWGASWKFLGSIYKNIFEWSINYERVKAKYANNPEHSEKITTGLLNFTRDVLDLSSNLLKGSRIIDSVIIIDDEGVTSSMTKDLLVPILPTLKDLFKWLRLSDTGLLFICVNIIKQLFDMCDLCEIRFEEALLTTLVKLCLKQSNSKMSKEQMGELLIKTRRMDSKLVERMSAPVLATPSPPPLEEFGKGTKLQSGLTYTSSKAKQATLDYFNKPGSKMAKAEVVDLTVPKRLSALEEARLKLQKKRVVAPARPDGFNRKHVDDSDSESDGDERSGASLFTKEQILEKMKKSKMALHSLQAPKAGTSANPANAKEQKLKQKKKEEELMRLKLNVDMSPLYEEVLKWNYNEVEDLPKDKSILDRCSPIKDKFDSCKAYQNSFEPLLLLECWQSIQRSKQLESETPFKVTLGSRSATDSFYDVYASIKKSLLNEKRYINDSDLVVLMLVDGLEPNEDEVPKSLARRCKLNCIAKVKEIKSTNQTYSDITFRISSKCQSFLNKISPQMEIVVMKVMTMTTIEREYSSLKGFQYYDLADEIIKAKPDDLYNPPQSKIEEIRKIYDVNESQARAISGTVQGTGFSLIQGPPGTGKTKTILGVIGYFLTNASLGIHQVMTPGTVQNGSRPKKKILICAPSNAAVDELVLRIKNGIKNSRGEKFNPNVVRLGKSDAINEQVRDLTLEEQVDKQLNLATTAQNDDSKIREEHRKCVIERDALKAKLEDPTLSADQVAELEFSFQKVQQRRRQLGQRLDESREQRAVKFRNREIERRNLQFKILNEAQVVCSTLSGSAHDVLARMSMTFDTVVIDEAAQCIELSAIIPLRYGCKKCIMVGDPNQLPPTVLSQKAASFNYEQSLFVRMQNNYKDSVYLLNTQYRMHPEISKFPSKEFYKSKLLDGPEMDEINKRPWHKVAYYTPYNFFQIDSQHSKNSKTMSLYNNTEALLCLEIIKDLFSKFPDVNWQGKIGIISPYKEQVRVLKNTFFREFGQSINTEVDFNTVDGFQGQEKDIILFSCVRADSSQSVGFLADIRRMNVALTRARASMWIIGSKEALVNNKTWRDLISDADSRKLVTHVQLGFTKTGIKSRSTFVSGLLPPPQQQIQNKRPAIENLNAEPQKKNKTDSDKKKKSKKSRNKDPQQPPSRKGAIKNEADDEEYEPIVKPIQSTPGKKLPKTGIIPPRTNHYVEASQIPNLPRNSNNNHQGNLDQLQNGPPQLIKISKKDPMKKFQKR